MALPYYYGNEKPRLVNAATKCVVGKENNTMKDNGSTAQPTAVNTPFFRRVFISTSVSIHVVVYVQQQLCATSNGVYVLVA